MKLKNKELSKLMGLYRKFINCELDEEDFDLGYELTVEALKVEESLKPYSTIVENATKPLKELKEGTEEYYIAVDKANKEINAAFEKETTLNLEKLSVISKDFIKRNKIKLTGIDINTLKEYKMLV